MQLKKPIRANAAHNYQAVLEQTNAAIDLLEKDPEVRKALKGFALAITVTETNAGQHSMLHNNRQYIGPNQINNDHAYAMRNTKEGLALRERLMNEEALPAKERDPQAQLLLNAGATAGVWTVSRANPYQNQGVLGAVSVIVAAKAAAKATGKNITDLNATEVWLPHKLGINGGTAVLKALTENPDTLVSEVESPYGTAVSKAAFKNNFKGNYHGATVEDIYDKTHAKFQRKVIEGVVDRLPPNQQALFSAVANVDMSQAPAQPKNNQQETRIAQIPTPSPRPNEANQPIVNASSPAPQTIKPSASPAPIAPPVIVASAAPNPASSKTDTSLKPLASLSTTANTHYRRLANNLVGLGKIEADMKPEARAEILAKYINENGGVKNALEQSMDSIKAMQVALQAEGTLTGAVDGLYGSKTRNAHIAYRDTHHKDPQALTTRTANNESTPPANNPPTADKPPSQANLPASQSTPAVVIAANNAQGRV